MMLWKIQCVMEFQRHYLHQSCLSPLFCHYVLFWAADTREPTGLPKFCSFYIYFGKIHEETDLLFQSQTASHTENQNIPESDNRQIIRSWGDVNGELENTSDLPALWNCIVLDNILKQLK